MGDQTVRMVDLPGDVLFASGQTQLGARRPARSSTSCSAMPTSGVLSFDQGGLAQRKLVIHGHTDDVGVKDANFLLGYQRAWAVYQEIRKHSKELPDHVVLCTHADNTPARRGRPPRPTRRRRRGAREEPPDHDRRPRRRAREGRRRADERRDDRGVEAASQSRRRVARGARAISQRSAAPRRDRLVATLRSGSRRALRSGLRSRGAFLIGAGRERRRSALVGVGLAARACASMPRGSRSSRSARARRASRARVRELPGGVQRAARAGRLRRASRSARSATTRPRGSCSCPDELAAPSPSDVLHARATVADAARPTPRRRRRRRSTKPAVRWSSARSSSATRSRSARARRSRPRRVVGEVGRDQARGRARGASSTSRSCTTAIAGSRARSARRPRSSPIAADRAPRRRRARAHRLPRRPARRHPPRDHRQPARGASPVGQPARSASGAVAERFTGAPRCSTRFADLPLWPRGSAGDEARLVEHVLGQLLFATPVRHHRELQRLRRSTGTRRPTHATELAADPIALLDARRRARAACAPCSIAAAPARDRRARDRARSPATAAATAAVDALVSLACFDRRPAAAARATGTTVAIDGETIGVREVRVPAIKHRPATGRSMSTSRSPRCSAARPCTPCRHPRPSADHLFEPGDDFLLARLDAAGRRRSVRRCALAARAPELVEVYPFEPHLHGVHRGLPPPLPRPARPAMTRARCDDRAASLAHRASPRGAPARRRARPRAPRRRRRRARARRACARLGARPARASSSADALSRAARSAATAIPCTPTASCLIDAARARAPATRRARCDGRRRRHRRPTCAPRPAWSTTHARAPRAGTTDYHAGARGRAPPALRRARRRARARRRRARTTARRSIALCAHPRSRGPRVRARRRRVRAEPRRGRAASRRSSGSSEATHEPGTSRSAAQRDRSAQGRRPVQARGRVLALGRHGGRRHGRRQARASRSSTTRPTTSSGCRSIRSSSRPRSTRSTSTASGCRRSA